MKLHGVPMAIVVFGTLSGVHAQQPPSRTVGIYTIGQQVPISDPTYAFAGVYFLSNGGANALAVTTPDGVVLIDAKLKGWGPMVLDTLQQVTDDPVVRIINTNADEDHVGANGEYGGKVEVLMHENASARLSKRARTARSRPSLADVGRVPGVRGFHARVRCSCPGGLERWADGRAGCIGVATAGQIQGLPHG